MSQEKRAVARQSIHLGTHPRRRLDGRMALRFPRALAFLARAVWRLPARSRVRKGLLRRAVRLSFEAINRRDYESTFGLYHPDCELITPPELVGLGFEYHGREKRIGFQRKWIADWGEFGFHPEEIIDLGDRALLVGHIEGSGLSSGVGFESEWANLLTISAGRVIGEQIFLVNADALEAAGLSK